jgi:DnaJ-class molecular chaperone
MSQIQSKTMSQVQSKTLNSNNAPAKCAWCAGTGESAVSKGYVISCLVCGGKGQVSMAQPAGQCRPCNGTGRRNATNPCLTCAGTGWGRVFDQG